MGNIPSSKAARLPVLARKTISVHWLLWIGAAVWLAVPCAWSAAEEGPFVKTFFLAMLNQEQIASLGERPSLDQIAEKLSGNTAAREQVAGNLKRALGKTEDPDKIAQIQRALVLLGQYDAALSAAEKIQGPRSNLMRAQAYYGMGLYNQAEYWANEALGENLYDETASELRRAARDAKEAAGTSPAREAEPDVLSAALSVPSLKKLKQPFIPPVALKTPASRRKRFSALRAYGSNMKALGATLVHAPWKAKPRVLLGILISHQDGDIFDSQPPVEFDSGKAVVFINGLKTPNHTAEDLAEGFTQSAGVQNVAHVENNTHCWRHLCDGFQVLGNESGAIDITAVRAVGIIRQALASHKVVYVEAHSNGTAIFNTTLPLLTREEKAKIHYEGFGPETYIDAKKSGLASAKNYRNPDDRIQIVENIKIFFHKIPKNAHWDTLPRSENARDNRHNMRSYFKKVLQTATGSGGTAGSAVQSLDIAFKAH